MFQNIIKKDEKWRKENGGKTTPWPISSKTWQRGSKPEWKLIMAQKLWSKSRSKYDKIKWKNKKVLILSANFTTSTKRQFTALFPVAQFLLSVCIFINVFESTAMFTDQCANTSIRNCINMCKIQCKTSTKTQGHGAFIKDK